MRVKFKKGEQRNFINLVLSRIAAPSLSELINRGVGMNYQTLKNYYSERRLMPEWLFTDLCDFSKIDKNEIEFSLIPDNWGQSKGGKISKRN